MDFFVAILSTPSKTNRDRLSGVFTGVDEVVIRSSFRTKQNIATAALHKGRQRLTRFNIVINIKTFGKPDRSWINCEQDTEVHHLRTDLFLGATSGEVAGILWCQTRVSKDETGHQR